MQRPRTGMPCLLAIGWVLSCLLGTAHALPGEPQTKPGDAGAPQSRPALHTFAEIAKIMEDSKLTYELDSDKDLPPPPAAEPPKGLSDQAWLVEEPNGGYSLAFFTLSEPARKKLAEAEKAYEAKDYDLALKGYEEVQKLQPDYHHVLTLIGDVYYVQGGYETAKSYYGEAIQKNFADYQAHWFLADALWNLGEKEAAIREITIAHLLNSGHANLRKVLLGYREKIGRPWKDWRFSPRYSLEQDGKKVRIRSSLEWLTYACVKAVWKYEPGYAERMAGPGYAEHILVNEEEKEALIAYLSQEKPLPIVSTIVDEGFTNEFLYYEILAPKQPTTLVMFPRQNFMRIVEYIDRYH